MTPVDSLCLQLFCGLARARPLADCVALFVRFAFLPLVFVLLALLLLL